MATNPLRWGILGTGNIARQFADGVAGSARGRIVAVGSRDSRKAATFADARTIPARGTYENVLADPGVDAVYNSLPNSMHHEWTLKALAAGKHVLCEKPFAADLAEAQEMFDAAQKHGLVLVEAFMYRSHPLIHAVMEKIRGGAIGQVRLIRPNFCFKVSQTAGNIRFSKELAGGALMDVGCYCLNFCRLVAGGEPTVAHAVARMHESGVDEITSVVLKFPGVNATFTCGMAVHADNTATIGGSEGFIEIPIPWKPPQKQAAYTIARSTPPRMDLPLAAQKVSAPPPTRETFYVDAPGPLYGMEADDFAATVQDGRPPVVTPQDTLGNMRLLDELRRQVGME